MGSDEDPPPWRDPLLSPLKPTGTGSGAYVEQPPPRANPMTVEGEIAAFGEMARGAARRPGWWGWFARILFGLMLVGIAAGIVAQLVGLFR